MKYRIDIQAMVAACLALACLICEGCADKELVKDTHIEAYQEPSLEFRGISFEDQTFDGMNVIFKFALMSRDGRDAQIKGCSYSFSFKDRDPVEGSIEAPHLLKSKQQVLLVSKLSIPWPSDKAKVVAFIEQKRIPYKYRVRCDLKTTDGALSIDAADSGTIPLPKLPKMDVIQANAERFGNGSDARINFELSMVNENPFKIRLEKIVYKVFLDGSEVAGGEIPLAEIVPASAEFTYDVATPIFNERDNKEIIEMLSREQIQYRLQGDIFLGEFKLPLDATGTISFSRASP